MKRLFFILFLAFSAPVFAQSLYDAKAEIKPSYSNSERFYVSFEKSLYGITFERNSRVLSEDLKQKIENFMKTADLPKFKGVGKFTLEIVKRGGKYYVLERKSPEKLLPL